MRFDLPKTFLLTCWICGSLLLPWANAGEPAVAPSGNEIKLQNIINATAAATLRNFADKSLESNQLAITLIDLADPSQPAGASYRGGVPIYPASVVKLFYLEAAHRWLEEGKLQSTDELRRAMRDMIVDSCNEATHYVVDVLTGTTSGPELPPEEMKLWSEKRNAVNRHFAARGYTNINVNQKPWNEGPYGRERIFVGTNYANRNALTTDATARLLAEIVLGRAVSARRSAEMMQLLERAPFKKPNEDEQATAYTGPALPAGAKLWSKAGWTSTVRHDAACVELPNGRRFVLVTFTVSHSNNPEIIPFVARQVIASLGRESQ